MREPELIGMELRDAMAESADIIDEKALHLHTTATDIREAVKQITNFSHAEFEERVKKMTTASTHYNILEMRHQEIVLKLLRLLMEFQQTLPEKTP